MINKNLEDKTLSRAKNIKNDDSREHLLDDFVGSRQSDSPSIDEEVKTPKGEISNYGSSTGTYDGEINTEDYRTINDDADSEAWCNRVAEYFTYLFDELKHCQMSQKTKIGIWMFLLFIAGSLLITDGSIIINQRRKDADNAIDEWNHKVFSLPTGNMTCDQFTGNSCNIIIEDCTPPCNISLSDTPCEDLWRRRYAAMCPGIEGDIRGMLVVAEEILGVGFVLIAIIVSYCISQSEEQKERKLVGGSLNQTLITPPAKKRPSFPWPSLQDCCKPRVSV